MQENSLPPFIGKSVNREREEQFVGSIEQFHGAKLLSSACNGDVSSPNGNLTLLSKERPHCSGANRGAALAGWKSQSRTILLLQGLIPVLIAGSACRGCDLKVKRLASSPERFS